MRFARDVKCAFARCEMRFLQCFSVRTEYFKVRKTFFSGVSECLKHFFECFRLWKALCRLFRTVESAFSNATGTFSSVSDYEKHVLKCFTMREALFQYFTMRKSLFRLLPPLRSASSTFSNEESTFHSTKNNISNISLCEKCFRAVIAVRKVVWST